MAHDADEHRHAHGNHHPGPGDAAGEGQLVLIPNGHEADQNVGHAEVPQAPGHHGDDADDAVGVRRSGGDVIGLREAEEAGEGLGVGDDRVHAARLDHTKDHDDG